MIDQRTAPYGALILRLALGAAFVAHALLKWLVLTFPGSVRFFEAHGVPGWTAYPVFGAELVGGACLILGVYVRQVSFILIPVLAGALTVHWPNGWNFAAPKGGWEYLGFLIAASVVQVFLGAGAYALYSPAVRAGAPFGDTTRRMS
jgi:putative oxidoreductase